MSNINAEMDEVSSDGKTKTLYSYHNGDASSAILTFVDNALLPTVALLR